jgi:hypothetical protein
MNDGCTSSPIYGKAQQAEMLRSQRFTAFLSRKSHALYQFDHMVTLLRESARRREGSYL